MVKQIFLAITFLLLTYNSISVFGQIPEIKRPQPSTLSPGVIVGNPHYHNSVTPLTPTIHYFNNSRQSFNIYERDRLEVRRRNIAMQQILNEGATRFGNIQYELPSRAELQGTAPSPIDINNAGSNTHYVFGRGNNSVCLQL